MGNRYPGPFAAPLIDADGVEVDPEGSIGAVFVLETDSYTMETFGTVGRPWSDEHAVFVEDRFKPSAHLTLELGLRAEAYRGRVRETPGDQHELDFGLDELIAPRLGVVWDFARNGRSRLFGRIGRYYESLPLQTSLIAFGQTSEVFRTFAYPADGSLPTYTNLGVLAFSEDVITDPMPVVPGTQQTHTDEASVGMEYELAQGLAVGLNLVYRELRDVIETLSFDESFVLGNPGGRHTVHPVTGETLEEPADYDEPVNEYRAVEVTVRRPLRDRWQLFASYVYAESQGNYTGSDGGAHASEQFDFPRLTEGGFGHLPGDRPHQLKAYGSYALPFGLVTGFVGQYYSGTPISKYGFWPDFYLRFVETPWLRRPDAGHVVGRSAPGLHGSPVRGRRGAGSRLRSLERDRRAGRLPCRRALDVRGGRRPRSRRVRRCGPRLRRRRRRPDRQRQLGAADGLPARAQPPVRAEATVVTRIPLEARRTAGRRAAV